MGTGVEDWDIICVLQIQFSSHLFSILNYSSELYRKHTGQLFSGEHIAGDNIHTDVASYNMEEPQQKYRLGMTSNILLRGVKHI